MNDATPQGETALVEIKDGKVIATSLRVADVFGKRHKNVLQAIQRLECSEEFSRLNFQPVEYLDAKGETRPMVEMTRDGWAFLVMGFTGAEAATWKERYIAQFNVMEGALRSGGDHELAERTNGISRMLAKKVTAQEKAISRVLEILEANNLPARVEVPSGATLVRQHARRVSTDRDTGLRMKALVERLERFFPSDAPPLMPMPDMHQHLVYRLYGHFLLVDTGIYNLPAGEKALVIDAHGRLTLAVMAVNGRQEGSLWSGDRRGWAYMTKAGGAPGECEIGLAIVVGRHLQTMTPEYRGAA